MGASYRSPWMSAREFVDLPTALPSPRVAHHDLSRFSGGKRWKFRVACRYYGLMNAIVKRMTLLAMTGSLALTHVGCVDWVAVRPSELPKLNNFSTETFSAGSTHLTVVTARNVRGADGRVVQITGEHDVLVTADGKEVSFEHPVEARVVDDTLTVAGRNREDTRFELATVEKVEVRQYSTAKRTALVVVLVGLSMVASVGIALAH